MLNDFGRFSQRRITVEECQRFSIKELASFDLASLEIDVDGQLIGITRSECNYGGTRNWFICPSCRKRIGTLYRKPLSTTFLCRQCNNLTYQLRKYHRSQNEVFFRYIKNLAMSF